MMKRTFFTLALIVVYALSFSTFGQNRDKAIFVVPKPGFYQNSILRDDRMVKEKTEPASVHKYLAVDLSSANLPD